MTERTVADVARLIVTEQAPEEISEFDLVARRFDASPAAARRAGRAHQETTASSMMLAGETMTTLALLVSSGVARSLRLTGRPAALPVWDPRGWWPARTSLTEPAPTIIEDQAPAVGDRVERELRKRGIDDALAASMAATARNSWPRRSR